MNKEKCLEAPINSKDSLLDKITNVLDNAKTEDIAVIDLENKSSIADYFVIATCRSSRHADATADEVSRQLKKIGLKCPNPAGRPQCEWVIVDAGSIIVHLFIKESRELYNLEKLWGITFESLENNTA